MAVIRRIPGKPLKDPRWYKDAIVYELHVRSFYDSDADGVGDFQGLTQKLDYLQDLGVTALWLLPFYPSPLKDDGYDIANYNDVNPIYGTLSDFRRFLEAAHERGLKVITELVVNHTSDQHPWFQRARRAPPGSAFRDFYVWSETPEKYKEARIIFRDFETSNWTWDRLAQAYFWHRFYSHQPDLNFDNPAVHEEVIRALDFWLDMGVDGLRLDAVPYLYEREGTSCENLPETHAFLKKLRHHVDDKYGDRMLLAEANQWPEDSAAYFGSGSGDECHAAFHFPLMPRIFMSVRMEDRVPITDILEQTPQIPETSQWALFLRNHDELTLEMVTDEERDYMYRVYANDLKARINLGIRRRLAPLLGNDRKRIELLHLLLLSFPGTPFLYYGDEIGMGDNVYLGDRNGVRTPMQWSSDKNAGFSRAHPHALYSPIILDPEYHYEAVNVEARQANPHSLWWWLKRVLALRKRYKAFGRGTIEFLRPDNRKVLAFIRRHEGQVLLILANLSRFPQPVSLDLAQFEKRIPIELFGRTRFPAITAQPYAVTLSPHAAFWFALEPAAVHAEPAESSRLVVVSVREGVGELWHNPPAGPFEGALQKWLAGRRWFSGKGREIQSLQVRDAIEITPAPQPTFLLLLHVEYHEGDPQDYLLPAGFLSNEAASRYEKSSPENIIVQVHIEQTGTEGILCEASNLSSFTEAMLDSIYHQTVLAGWEGELLGCPEDLLKEETSDPTALTSSSNTAEQSNTALVFGGRYFLKLYRRLEPGINPDLELGRFLTQRKFPHVPPVAGSLHYQRKEGEQFTLGLLTRYFPESQDAWQFTLEGLTRFFERARTSSGRSVDLPSSGDLFEAAQRDLPESNVRMLGTYSEIARLLGQRTGELHLALASETEDPNFTPEPFTPFYQRSLYQSMRNLAARVLDRLRRSSSTLPKTSQSAASTLLQSEGLILKRFRAIYDRPIQAKRIRCHGDYHLGQVLHARTDFIIIDFEGEPARPLSERRIKRSPMRDVAGMVRSFDYVTHSALTKYLEQGAIEEPEMASLEPWARFWYQNTSAVFLRAYFAVVAHSGLFPSDPGALRILLDAHLLEKAIYEVGYELANRPKWVRIPLSGILQLLGNK